MWVKFLDQDPDEIYDWTVDVMNDHWSAGKARKKLLEQPGEWRMVKWAREL